MSKRTSENICDVKVHCDHDDFVEPSSRKRGADHLEEGHGEEAEGKGIIGSAVVAGKEEDIKKTPRPTLPAQLADAEARSLRESLSKMFIGREEQVFRLTQLLNQPPEAIPPFLYIHGGPSTGKTQVTRSVLKALAHDPSHVAWVDCVSNHTPRLIFETVLGDFLGEQPIFLQGEGRSRVGRCDNESVFSVRLTDACISPRPYYLVLDRAERLRQHHATLIPFLSRLPELVRSSLCVIFLSILPYARLLPAQQALPQALLIHFPEYTREETVRIITRTTLPPDTPEAQYTAYVDTMYRVFERSCRDLRELRWLCQALWDRWCEPIRDRVCKPYETGRLFKAIQPFLTTHGDRFYLRELAYDPEEAQGPEKDKEVKEEEERRKAPALSSGESRKVDLPLYGKYLLISSFLASYNPQKMDKRYFSHGPERDGRGRKKRRVEKDKTGGRHRQQLLGPKMFSMERLLAIFFVIAETPCLDEGVAPPLLGLDVHQLLRVLIELGWVTRVGSSAGYLSDIRLRCDAGWDVILEMSKEIDFDMDRFLYDFTK